VIMADPNSEDIGVILDLANDIRKLTFSIEARARSIRHREPQTPRGRCQAMNNKGPGGVYQCLRFAGHLPRHEHFYEDQIWPGV
jgi:hypothetical protein